jgi:hypothetical protein
MIAVSHQTWLARWGVYLLAVLISVVFIVGVILFNIVVY